ncbi:U-box domain-containing protein 32 [Rosa sericea]
MALELIAGSVFAVFYDRVSRAVDRKSEFRYLLTHMKRTLESLTGQARFIREIREFNDELSLPNHDIADLETQMIEGSQLVGRMSSFRMYNYCCMDGCHDQLYELNRSLDRLLDNLQLQQARDVKEILKLSRQNRDDLDEMKGMLKMILQQINDPEMKGLVKKLLEQNVGDSTETSTSASGSNTVREGNDEAQVESVEAAFRLLFDVIIEVKDKSTLMLRPIIRHLKSTLDCLKPLIEDITQHNNKALDRPKKELEAFGMQMKNGVELVRKCSKIHQWTSNETYKYTSQLFELDESVQRQLSVLIVQLARDVKETSVMRRNVRKVVERIEGISGVTKNQQLALDVAEVNETRDVRETMTFVSARNVEAELTVVDGEDGEVPEPPSFTVGLDVPLGKSKMSGDSGQKPIAKKKEKSKMRLLDEDRLLMLDPTAPHTMKGLGMPRTTDPNKLGALKSLPGMPRKFSYRELKKATNNFDLKHTLGQGGGYGAVYRGLLAKDNLEVAVKKYSRLEIKCKDDFLAELAIINRLRHKHLVRLLGWCRQKKMLLIVHDFMPNGSLDHHLFSGPENTTLAWSQRYKIISGVASVLNYLHNEFDYRVVHRNIKPSNIMLDSDFNARLGDFGLRRAYDNEKTSYSELEGLPNTEGYIAPECFHTGKATCESDVYGFGAVALEVVCGQRPWDKIGGFPYCVDWVWSLHREGRVLEAVDERLGNEYDVEEAQRLLLLGMACFHPIVRERPKSQTILQVVSGSIPAPILPPYQPKFMWPQVLEGSPALPINTGNT